MRTDRLLKLAAFLDHMPEEKFDFTVIAHPKGKPMLEALAAGHEQCGTVGCAMGWLPAVFPEEFKWESQGWNTELTVVDSEGEVNFGAAAHFFEIDPHDADLLFMPGEDDSYSGLPETASAKEVAAHIRKFVEEQ